MSTTMQDLFDDDSSDDEDVVEKKGPPSPPVDGTTTKRVIQEDSSDDDEGMADPPPPSKPPAESRKESKEENPVNEKAEIKEGDVEMSEPKPAAPSTTATNEEGDDEEEDVEFDDAGDVVGASAPPPLEQQESTGVATASSRPTRKKPRHIQVLESERPPPLTSLHITKLPNFVGIQPEAFDPNTYSADIEEKDFRGNVHSMIRWRYAKTPGGVFKRDSDNQLIRESNARLVAWDDGEGGPKSYTLHVGTEVFEVDVNDSSSSNGFAGLNGYLYLSQKATLDDEDHTPAGTVLECMGAISSRLIARPSSLQSEAHKKLTVAVRQKTIQKAKIAMHVTAEDPEKAKQDRIRVKQDLEKAQTRKRQSYGYNSKRTAPSMSRRYMEEDDGLYDSVNIRDLKRARDLEDMDYGEDSEEDDDDEDVTFNRNRPAARAKSARRSRQEKGDESDIEEDELVFEEESDDDAIKATSRKNVQHQALVDEDDDD